jgi:hypothetical protein
VAWSPILDPPIVSWTAFQVGDVTQISDSQRPDAMLHGKGDRRLGSLVVAQAYSAPVPNLSLALARSETFPSAWARLPLLPAGSAATRQLPVAGFLVGQVKARLGSQCAAREKQSGVIAGDGYWVDYPQIDTRDTVGVQVMLLYGNRRSHVQREAPALHKQGDGANLFGQVRDWLGEPQPQRRTAAGYR